MYDDNIKVFLFCEIIINRGVLIFVDFVDFVVHVNLKNQDPKKFNFPIDCCLQCLNIIVYEFRTLYKSLVFCAVFCRSLFVLWPFLCLSFCHLRLLNTSCVSSNLSDIHISDHLQCDREYMPTIPTQSVIIVVDVTVYCQVDTPY